MRDRILTLIGVLDFNDNTSVRGSDENLHLVERFTRTDRDTIESITQCES